MYDTMEYRELPIECAHVQVKHGTVIMETIETNKDCRIYHFRVAILGYCIWEKRTGVTLGESMHPSLIPLTEINGIEGFHLSSGYEVWVSKAIAWEWDEIESRIIQTLHDHNSFERIVS